MLRLRLAVPVMLLAAVAGIGGVLYAQLESAERGILPLDSSNTLEIGGIHVDVGGADAESARYAGWRIAQRQGFKALWAKMHGAPISEAPNLPDNALDQIVSSINVESEQIGPNRYIADLGVLFDRGRAAPFLGMDGSETEHSATMLLIPVTVTGGTETSVELRNAWQRAWAQFRTVQSPIDYVRVSGMGADPLLINAAQARRPGRGWWRSLLEMYGAADVLVAEVQLQRLYPGGPARARFIARHGPDGEVIGGFTLTSANSDGLASMMAQGAERMDQLFGQALAAGRLTRDPSLDLPPPPVLPQLPTEQKQAGPISAFTQVQVQVTGKNVTIYNFAMAHLHTLPGVQSATPQQINPGGTSYILVSYKGSFGELAAALAGRGWTVESSGTVIRIQSNSDRPPPIPPPPPVTPPAPAQLPAQTTNQAAAQPPKGEQ